MKGLTILFTYFFVPVLVDLRKVIVGVKFDSISCEDGVLYYRTECSL
jgi:hypothetical protein